MNNPISIAPMMDHTDRHFRYFMRGITRHTLLYTPMIGASAIIQGDRQRLLAFSEQERPLVLQLGGSVVKELVEAAQIARDWGYDSFNLNVGCPSNRVRAGSFGACLMARPDMVGEAVAAIQSATGLPVSVKHRLGIIDRKMTDRKTSRSQPRSQSHSQSLQEPTEEHIYEELFRFVHRVAQYGCRHFIVHARLAVLGGFSTQENLAIPPLRPGLVRRLASDFPDLRIEINGGIRSLASARSCLERDVEGEAEGDGEKEKEKEIEIEIEKEGEIEDRGQRENREQPGNVGAGAGTERGRVANSYGRSGRIAAVMIGRAAYEDPYIFAAADREIYGCWRRPPTRREALKRFARYLDRLAEDSPVSPAAGPGADRSPGLRHILNLFRNIPGGRFFRQSISNRGNRGNYSSIEEWLQAAAAHIPSQHIDNPSLQQMPVFADFSADPSCPLGDSNQ